MIWNDAIIEIHISLYISQDHLLYEKKIFSCKFEMRDYDVIQFVQRQYANWQFPDTCKVYLTFIYFNDKITYHLGSDKYF